MRRAVRIALVAVAAVAAGGCGLGAGRGSSGITLTVTHGFGSRQVATIAQQHVPGSETVMRILLRSFRVQTRYGGGFVESIDGLSGNASRLDWFYYVNGIEAPAGAATTAVHGGDHIWWDLHDWTAAQSIPAVVGSFPEPFVHGDRGKRLPTTLECAADVQRACRRVASELSAVGVPVATQFLGTGSGTASLAVLVGTWRDLSGTIAAGLIEHGVSTSGVYARFARTGGRSLELLDPRGRVARTLGAGAGLVAATSQGSAEPTWIITGTDVAAVSAAAAALTPSRLRDHFALAVQGRADIALPVQGGT